MPPDSLSTTFAALADPTRRAILADLIAGDKSVNQLAEPFEMSLHVERGANLLYLIGPSVLGTPLSPGKTQSSGAPGNTGSPFPKGAKHLDSFEYSETLA